MSHSRRNLAVVYKGPQKVAVEDIGYPVFKDPRGNPANHAVIVKTIATNICGSDLHMYRGKTDFPPGMAFGHEITGEVVEIGSQVNRIKIGDIISTPFNISCGTCKNCTTMKTSLCLTVNEKQIGGAFGFADMGGWQGGQAEYVLVPFADFQCLVLPRHLVNQFILDLAFLSDILPTGFNACVQAGVTVGRTVYIGGAGPVGICAAASAILLGAAIVVVGDVNPDRLTNIDKLNKGILTIDLSKVGEKHADLPAALEKIIGVKQVDCSIDAVGFEACGHGRKMTETVSEQVLNSCFSVTKTGGCVGIPGVYVPQDPSGVDAEHKNGYLPLSFGEAWQKGLKIEMGQCPVKNYHFELMMSIVNNRIKVSDALNVKIISLAEAPEAYKHFNKGQPVKYIIDAHNSIIHN